MTKDPLFSIITPTHNAYGHLEKCINSIFNQSFSKWEHIIVDGGSSDGTLELIKKYPHLKWISEPDVGIYDAMNKGIKLAKGEWLYFLGADDYLYDNKVFENLISHLKSNVDVVYGNVSSTRWNGLYDGEFNSKKITDKNICHQAIFLRRIVFDKVGLFNLRFKVYADWEHNWRWFFNPSIKHKYAPLTIAEYADGGFSSNSLPDQALQSTKDAILKELMSHNEWILYMNRQMVRKENDLRKSCSTFRLYFAKTKRLIFLVYNKFFSS